MTFKEFDFEAGITDGLDSMGFQKATPIQEMAIPHVTAGKDLIACAQTGTGKTAAFLLPIINKIEKNPGQRIDTLIIVPTRELAMQIDQQLTGFSYFTNVSSMAIYGGGDAQGFVQEKHALTTGVNIIVATPGKLIAHLNLGYVKLDKMTHLVLDEADRMLDMGFYEDITRIIRHCPSKRQTLMFSATMPPKIRTFARNILTDPEEVSLSISKPAAGIEQAAYMVHNNQKIKLVAHLLKGKEEEYPSVIIFSSTKRNVKAVTHENARWGDPF
jgi:ATP-dependent RNA helicase RhlE